MRLLYHLFILLLILTSCNNNLQTNERAVSTPADTITSQEELSMDTIIDNTIIPDKEKHYPGQLLYVIGHSKDAMVYHNDEVKKEWQNKKWYALVKTGNRCAIQEANISIQPGYDVIVDDDTSQKTGWEVRTDIVDTAIIHLSGIANIQEGIINDVQLPVEFVKVGDTTTFNFEGISYKLYASGLNRNNNVDDFMNVVNYKMYLETTIDSKRIAQVIFAASKFDDAFPSIIFIGDIDKDGKPDILLNAVWHYNEFVPALYLSGERQEGQILQLVAIHSSVGC